MWNRIICDSSISQQKKIENRSKTSSKHTKKHYQQKHYQQKLFQQKNTTNKKYYKNPSFHSCCLVNPTDVDSVTFVKMLSAFVWRLLIVIVPWIILLLASICVLKLKQANNCQRLHAGVVRFPVFPVVLFKCSSLVQKR